MKAHHYGLALWCLAMLPAGVQADEKKYPVEFRDAWIRAAPPSSPVLAGYVAVVNPGKREITIARTESPDFGAVELHEMRMVDGVMRMRPLPQLPIEPESTVELAPGGTHLMLFRPVRELKIGERVSIAFVLGAGERVAVKFEVRPATTRTD